MSTLKRLIALVFLRVISTVKKFRPIDAHPVYLYPPTDSWLIG